MWLLLLGLLLIYSNTGSCDLNQHALNYHRHGASFCSFLYACLTLLHRTNYLVERGYRYISQEQQCSVQTSSWNLSAQHTLVLIKWPSARCFPREMEPSFSRRSIRSFDRSLRGAFPRTTSCLCDVMVSCILLTAPITQAGVIDILQMEHHSVQTRSWTLSAQWRTYQMQNCGRTLARIWL